MKYLILIYTLLLISSCSENYVSLKNCIDLHEVSSVLIEKPYGKSAKKIICTDKHTIESLYDFFYKNEKEAKEIIIFDVPYKITFYSKTKQNTFWFNDSTALSYHDSNNHRYVFVNQNNGKIIFDTFFKDK